MSELHFTCGGREWVARCYINEANTRIITRVVPVMKGPPWPTRSEHQAAVEAYHKLDLLD
jgi:hypothetical protein